MSGVKGHLNAGVYGLPMVGAGRARSVSLKITKIFLCNFVKLKVSQKCCKNDMKKATIKKKNFRFFKIMNCSVI